MAAFFVIAILLSVLYFAIIIYYRFAWKSIPLYNPTPNSQSPIPKTSLSIIIPARNEASNIENCINSILENNYPTALFEIIVVDDHSEDETAMLVKEYEQQNVQLISLKDFVNNPLNSFLNSILQILR